MAARAFMCKIVTAQGTSNPNEISMVYEVCYADDTGTSTMTQISTTLLVTDTLVQMRDKMATDIRSTGDSLGYDVSANNSLVLLQFLKT